MDPGTNKRSNADIGSYLSRRAEVHRSNYCSAAQEKIDVKPKSPSPRPNRSALDLALATNLKVQRRVLAYHSDGGAVPHTSPYNESRHHSTYESVIQDTVDLFGVNLHRKT